MSEYDRPRAHDDTQPLAGGDQHQHHHRYAGQEPTSTYPTAGGYEPHGGHGTRGAGYDHPYGPFFASTGSPEPTGERGSRPVRGGLMAAALAGTLVAGGLAGFGGAATYDLVNPGTGTPGSSTGTTTSVVQRQDAAAPEGSAQDVAESVLPSVVKINVRGPQGAGSGSGIILSADGEILTNFHVVEVAEQGGAVSVGFNDGTTAPADVVGTDPLTDLAIIQARDVSGLTPAALGQSGNLDVGEQVVAIGSPFGLDATVTSGIVSALHRPVWVSGQGSAINTAYPAVQTDAAINPGNSGGPLVNMNGEVVGVNSSIRTSATSSGDAGGSIGLGFAIPLDEVLPIVDQLRNGQEPTHAQLGVGVADAVSEDGLVSGAGVSSVSPGSAAEAAGLEPGDVIVKVDDTLVTDRTALVATIRGHRPGDTVKLTVVRGEETLELTAALDSDAGQS